MKFRSFIVSISPPFLVPILNKTLIFLRLKREVKTYLYSPTWHTIVSGPLQGREIFVVPHDGYWQREVVEGNYDQFFFDYLKRFNLKGKTIFDVGAHIGYHALSFARLVGSEGKVYAFEPNPHNIERFQKILTKNKDLEQRIKILDFAISDKNDETIFHFNSNIENGQSSGGYVSGAHTPSTEKEYKIMGFKQSTVQTVSIDKFCNSLVTYEPPLIIKIDVEGAENLVLEGAADTLRKNKTCVLLEIHSIFNALHASNFFKELGYSLELIHENSDGRCFVSATPKP